MQGFPCGSTGKESACNAGDLGVIPWLGRSPGEGKGYPPQYSDLENSIDCIVHGVTKSWTCLSDFHFYFIDQISSVHSLSRVQIFATLWTVGSSVHGISQARILEWVAISFSRGSSQPRDRTRVSHMAGRCFIL